MDLSFKLEVFEGPLDLLLHLIEKNKVSIYDIPIVLITDQYLDYVSKMEKQDLDIVSEFMVMAATLIDIKSRMLLPPEEDENGEEIDPREELVARLVEYKMYKTLSAQLKEKLAEASKRFYKAPSIPDEVSKYKPPVDMDELLADVTLSKLHDVYRMVMRRQVDKIDPVRSKFGTIQKEKIKLSDKLSFIQKMASGKRKKFSFRELLEKQESRTEVVVTFLAVLELMKLGAIETTQKELFGDIELEWKDSTGAVELSAEDLAMYDE
ncbi:MAG: segregation/condensation protein A [Lachnospiraceae bacterium]|nr:segregation/condensation protein A [Lachnospiraceae bacterium]